MTRNQIAYWQNVETKRANLEKESQIRRVNTETERSNLERERLNRYNAKVDAYMREMQRIETHRSNIAREQLQQQQNDINRDYNTKVLSNRKREIEVEQSKVDNTTKSIAETRRANLAQENLKSQAQVETQRYNRYVNNLSAYNAYNSYQMDRLKAYENIRHDIASENLQQFQNATNRYNAMNTIRLGFATLSENTRSHLANEELTRQRFVVDLTKQGMSNMADYLKAYASYNRR